MLSELCQILVQLLILISVQSKFENSLTNNRVYMQVWHLEKFESQTDKVTSHYATVTKELNKFNATNIISLSELQLLSQLKLAINYNTQYKVMLFPKVILNNICRLTAYHNSLMLVHDLAASTRDDFNKPADYIIHMLSSLGIPTITWFPDKAGQYEPDQSTLSIRLEPTNWHIVHGIVDLMKAYNWTRVALVVSNLVPDSSSFVKEMKLLQKNMDMNTEDSTFKFEISQIRQVRGLSIKEIMNCGRDGLLCPFIKNMINILEKLYNKDDRVMVYHGYDHEMIALLQAIKHMLKGPKRYLSKLFGADYIWICTPSLMSIVSTNDRGTKIDPDLAVVSGSWNFKVNPVATPGMFVFVTFNNHESYAQKAKIAYLLWQKSLAKLMRFIKESDVGKKFNSTNDILSHLISRRLCRKTPSKWFLGNKLFQIMKSTTLKIDDEYIGFLSNGAINTTEMFIFNSKSKDKLMSWHKVGSWSLSSKWGKSKAKLRIDGVTWPGNEVKPPKGRPDKFRLRVVTIKEVPFVIYRQSETEQCDANSIKCYIRSETGKPRHVDSSVNYKLFGVNVASNYPYVHGCCSGLTMDMLSEFMKDLDFEVDLFDVPDGIWGGWTPNGWNGLVKVLKDGTADMAVTSFKVTPNRSEQIDFSVPFQETGIAIIVALREGGISPTAFLEPYDYQSWCVILVFSVHACGAALFIYEWLSPHGLDRGNQVSQDHKFSFFRSLWLIWSMLFGAAVNADNPRGTASRFLANIWALFALVFLASYTANLAAFMIAKDDFYDLTGIKDNHLMNPRAYKPPFTFATVPSGATEENIQINFKNMYSYMKKFNKSSVKEGLKALKTGEINAFIYDSNVLEYWAARDEKCKLKTVGNLFAMTGYGVAFPKNSKWLNKINVKILEYQNNGKLQRWKRFWLTGACKKDRRLDSTNKKLGVKNFISAFILLLGGIILCSILLLLEHAFYRYLRPHLTNIDRYGCCGLVSISMGQILSFEQSVNQTVDLMKHHKCNNPICESRQIKSRTESDQLKSRLKSLEKALIQERLDKSKLKQIILNNNHSGAFVASNHPSTDNFKKSTAAQKLSSKQIKAQLKLEKSLIKSLNTSSSASKKMQQFSQTTSQSATTQDNDLSDICETPTFVYECGHPSNTGINPVASHTKSATVSFNKHHNKSTSFQNSNKTSRHQKQQPSILPQQNSSRPTHQYTISSCDSSTINATCYSHANQSSYQNKRQPIIIKSISSMPSGSMIESSGGIGIGTGGGHYNTSAILDDGVDKQQLHHHQYPNDDITSNQDYRVQQRHHLHRCDASFDDEDDDDDDDNVIATGSYSSHSCLEDDCNDNADPDDTDPDLMSSSPKPLGAATSTASIVPVSLNNNNMKKINLSQLHPAQIYRPNTAGFIGASSAGQSSSPVMPTSKCIPNSNVTTSHPKLSSKSKSPGFSIITSHNLVPHHDSSRRNVEDDSSIDNINIVASNNNNIINNNAALSILSKRRKEMMEKESCL